MGTTVSVILVQDSSQNVASFSRDPEAQGYGIYLVLWFGTEHCRLDAEGRTPASAAELRSMLSATLSTEEARKISVCVMDVSRR